jgi:hypothetical protein
MDVDVDIVETELNAYTRVQQVPLDTDPLMWWNQHVQELHCLVQMVRQAEDKRIGSSRTRKLGKKILKKNREKNLFFPGTGVRLL